MTEQKMQQVEIYTDGACRGNPGPGGWGAILRSQNREKEIAGGAEETTNNRMEMMAAIKALEALTRSCRVTIHSHAAMHPCSHACIHASVHGCIDDFHDML